MLYTHTRVHILLYIYIYIFAGMSKDRGILKKCFCKEIIFINIRHYKTCGIAMQFNLFIKAISCILTITSTLTSFHP